MTAPMDERLMEAAFRIEVVAADISEIKDTMRALAVAVNKLALVEERQAHDRESMIRVFKSLETHETRIKTLELAQPVQNLTSGWFQSALCIVVGGVMSAILTLVVYAVPTGKMPMPSAIAEKLAPKN